MIIGIFVLILFIVLYNLHFLRFKKYIGNIKRLTNTPIIGDLYIFFKSKSIDKSVTFIVRKATELQETCVLWLGPKLVIAVVNPEDVKTVLTSSECYEKPAFYVDVFHDLGPGAGLLYSKVAKWKPHRRLLNSSFNVHRVTSLSINMDKIANDLIIRLESLTNKETFNIFPLMHDVSTNLTLMAHFDENYSNQEISTIARDIEHLSEDMWRRMVACFTIYPLYYLKHMFSKDLVPTVVGTRTSKYLKIMQKHYKLFCDKMDDDTKVKINSEENIRKHPDNLITRICRMLHYEYLTMDESVDHLLLILHAGAETTAVALSSIILLIGMHGDIQENVYNEIKTVLSEKNQDELSLDGLTLNQFEYVDRVIKECLRLFPAALIVGRKNQKDIQLENGIIPSGTDILIPIYSIHRNQKYWGPNAEKFNPDNFLPENVEKRHRCSYIPFSYGNRNCIASQYAQIFLKFMVIKIFNKYKFTTELKLDEIKFKLGIISKVYAGYNVKIEKR